MTAITLNLLAEEQLAEQANARDPVKTTTAIGTTLLMISVLCGSLLWMEAGQKRTEATLLQSRWDNLNALQTTGAGTDFKSAKSYADDLVSLSRSRTLYAHQLALIKDLVPDSVQLDRINLALNTEVREGGETVGGDTAASTGKDKAKPTRTAKPRNVESLRLQLDGKAVSSHPEMEVDKFLQSLRTDPEFSAQVEQIQLRSIARSPVSGDSASVSLPSATFVIECQYKEQK